MLKGKQKFYSDPNIANIVAYLSELLSALLQTPRKWVDTQSVGLHPLQSHRLTKQAALLRFQIQPRW